MYLTEGRLYDIQAKIKHICIACDRKPEEIRILPVTKTHSTAVLQAAFSLGLHRFGENKIQEAQQKARVLQDLPVRWCMIGHLQTNKAKYAARFADEVHSLDSIKLAKVLEQHLQKLGKYFFIQSVISVCLFNLNIFYILNFVGGYLQY